MSSSKKSQSPKTRNPPHFECTKCGACCRDDKILVTVTNSDILRIAMILELSSPNMLRALDFYILDESTPTPIGLEKIPYIITEQGRAYVALKKMENGDCIFLKDNQCMIHSIRPMVCRAFPFVFSRNNNELNWGLSSKKAICPGLGVGERMSEKELISLAEEILEELETFQKFANSWNNKSEAKTAFGFISEVLTHSI